MWDSKHPLWVDFKSSSFVLQSKLNALKTMVRIAPDMLLPGIVDRISKLLNNQDIVMVTRDEYGAYLCEEGQLFDKQLADRLVGKSSFIIMETVFWYLQFRGTKKYQNLLVLLVM